VRKNHHSQRPSPITPQRETRWGSVTHP